MPMRAFMFPGQGSQYVGMARDLADHPKVAGLFATVKEVLGEEFLTIMFDGPEQELKQTKNTQPAIYIHSMALAHLLPRDGAGMAAGHSLGEYSALVFAGALSFEDGLRIVRLRGELMQQAGEDHPGTMAAVIGLEPDAVDAVCAEASEAGIVQSANFNSPGQVVVSGSVAGVHRAMELAKAKGAKLVKELVVSGAFHSPLMESAQAGLAEALRGTTIRDASIPVYANVTAAPVQKAAEIRDLLVRQVTEPVRWEASMRSMRSDGGEEFIEVGPGKVLQGLARRIVSDAIISGIDTRSDAEGGLK